MRVLLSIKPEHVQNIISGVKRYEYRRRIFSNPEVRTVVIYCTRPVGLLVAEFDVAATICESPEALWKKTSSGSGISREFFDEYFEGRQQAYAIEIGHLRVYDEPIEPTAMFDNFFPPQSYMYLKSQNPQMELPMA